MDAGQQAFSVATDVAALDACAAELAAEELLRGAGHVRQLRVLLRMQAVGRASGMELGTVAHAALALGCSEHRAGQLLREATGLGELPGALEAVDCGLLTVEQGATVVEQLEPLPFATRRSVWTRLQQHLMDVGAPLPPARLAERLRRWIIAADPRDATERRRRAEQGRRLGYRRRADGLADLFAMGFAGPDLQSVLSRIRDRAYPVGSADDRTADQRRFDAFKDLLLGRDPLPLDDPPEPSAACGGGGGRAGCGCWPGSPVPCGAELLVHLTLGTGLGSSDEPAELVGHGPIDPELLEQLLLAAPRLRPVWTGADGVPVAVGDQVLVPERGDPASVREALLRLADLPPPVVLHPRHPRDHLPGPPASAPRHRLVPPALTSPASTDAARLADAALDASTDGAHPTNAAGRYRLPRRLRRLIDVRSPRCEWPGCGARAVVCDAEHDLRWPAGPTCACNLGPCCRRHHRVKQLGWTKTRRAIGVTWTSPGRARSWLSPMQHHAPSAEVRPVPPVATASPLDGLSPLQLEDELWSLDVLPDDPAAFDLRAVEGEPAATEHELAALLRDGATAWTLDLDDPYLWQEQVDAAGS